MNSITAKLTNFHQPFPPSLNNHHQIISAPISSLSFKNHSSTPCNLIIKASSSNPSCKTTLNPLKFESFSLLKTTFVAAVAATALFFSRFNFIAKPAIAATLSPPQAVETKNDAVSDEGKEREIEEHLVYHLNDINALKTLMEIRIKSKKIDEAVDLVDRLIEIQPNEVEWPLLKSHLFVHNGDVESARVGFSEIIDKDPLRVEAYHGLVMGVLQDDSAPGLKGIVEMIEEGMKLAKKQRRKHDLRDFKLLIAQVRVIEGKYDEALDVYKELVKEEPRDFRPYLCQGIIYTMLRKNSEAEKNFEKYRRLVPKGHPYARHFDDNMIATKLFAQKVGSERVGIKV